MGKKPTYEELEQRIKELEKINNEFSQKEAFFREFFEDDLTGDFITDSDGMVIQCNPAFLNIFGFKSLPEIINHNIIKAVPVKVFKVIVEIVYINQSCIFFPCLV